MNFFVFTLFKYIAILPASFNDAGLAETLKTDIKISVKNKNILKMSKVSTRFNTSLTEINFISYRNE